MMDPKNKYTEKADCYSFGCLLWELLAGKVPWEGIHYCMILVIVQNDKFQGLPEDDSWPKKLRDLIRQCVIVSSRCFVCGASLVSATPSRNKKKREGELNVGVSFGLLQVHEHQPQ